MYNTIYKYNTIISIISWKMKKKMVEGANVFDLASGPKSQRYVYFCQNVQGLPWKIFLATPPVVVWVVAHYTCVFRYKTV